MWTTRSPMRDQILQAAVKELAVNGTDFFNTPHLCEQLHIARTLINHHFGNQLKLIVEAAVYAYEEYIQTLKKAAEKETLPERRLEAWMSAQHEWFVHNRGIAALLQMPHPKYAALFSELFEARMQKGFRYNMAVLASLVRGVQMNEAIPLDFTEEDAPYNDFLAQNLETLMRTASVGMSSLGASVWAAGQTLPSRNVNEAFLQSASFTQHQKWVLRTIVATT